MRDVYPAYIGWDEFARNQQTLRDNWFRAGTRGAPRRGQALLQGIARCGRCGARMSVFYYSTKEKRAPGYGCVAGYVDGGATCQMMSSAPVDAAVSAIYLALREEAAPSGMRIYDAAEAARHFDGLSLPPGHALLCAATAGPTDLAACDRDLIGSAVAAEGGSATDPALADLWWRRLHAGELQHGDEQVHRAPHVGDGNPRRDLARPPGEERLAHAPFPRAPLAVAE